MKLHRLIKTVITFLTVLTLLLCMLACGTDTMPSSDERKVPPADDAINGSPKNPDQKSFDGTILNVIDISYGATNAMKNYIPEFEEQTGIKVNFEVIEHTSATTKQEMELGMSSDAYDVMHICADKVTRYASAGWVENLSGYLNDPVMTPASYNYEDMWEIFRNIYVRDGDVYGIPVSCESFILYYRTDIFDQLGLAPPSTWDEVEECAKTISEKTNIDGFGSRTRKGAGINMAIFPSFFYAYGASYLDQGGNPVINSDQFIMALNKYASIIQNYGPAGYGDLTHNELYPMFAQGTLAMYFDSSHMMSNFVNPEISKVIDKWDAVGVPAGPAGKAAHTFSHGLCIPAASNQKEAAWEYIKWYTNLENQTRLAGEHKFPGSVRREILGQSSYQEYFGQNNYLNALEDSLSSGRADFHLRQYVNWGEIGDLMGQGVQDVVLGSDAKTRMDQANDDLTKLLRDNGYIK